MKKPLLLLGICVLSLYAMAHEFWLLPQKFFYTIREVAHIRFFVGEDFKGANWSGNKERIRQLTYYPPSSDIIDISSNLSLNKGDSLLLPLQEEGTHMVIFNSNNSFISQDAAKFNDYLTEDGLDNVMNYRREHQEENKTSTEHYQRSVKTIVQVSGKLTDACTSATTLPLDIIPEENPYSIPVLNGKEGLVKVRFRILFNKQPLYHALVKVWYHLPGNVLQTDTFRTNKRGWITADRHPGHYLVSCVHMEPTPADKEAEWQSYWASLSFEYSQFFLQQRARPSNP
jgi:hypothetical protein